MYDDYEERKVNNKNGFDLNKILNILMIIIGGIMVIVLVVWLTSSNDNNPQEVVNTNKYEDYENKLRDAADAYNNKNVLASSEKYLSSMTLGVTLPSNCSLASGVITSGNLNQPYLLCSDYETDLFETKGNSTITLVGKNVYIIAKGDSFIDPGYVSREPVIVSGSVGEEEGVYNIYYVGKNTNEMANRKVIVTDDSRIKNMFPSIKLNGEENIYIVKNSKYKDLGAKATDPTEGDISYKINRSGKVNTNEIGEYKLSYSVSNKSGFSVSTTRTVTVLNDVSELVMMEDISPKEKTNQAVTINMKVLGENYAYSYLPTGEKVTDAEFSYSANNNGTYHFWAYDKYGRYVEKVVKIGNIDRVTPTFTCDANIYGNRVDVIVTSISKPIKQYKFIVNDSESEFLEQTSYVKNITKFESAKVEVVDAAGNHSVGECTKVLKDPSIGNNNIKYYNYNGTEYVIANTKNDLTEFVRQTSGKISQSVFSGTDDPDNCTSQCLGFSLYHAGFIQVGNIYNMSARNACNYNLIKPMTHTFYPTKAAALEKVYNEIFNGRVCVLQVTGTRTRSTRHFVLVVGYRRSKYFASDLNEEDLLTIDSWTGNFCTLSEADISRRTMFANGAQGYRVDHF